MISCRPARAGAISFTERARRSQHVTQYGSPVLCTPTPGSQRGLGTQNKAWSTPVRFHSRRLLRARSRGSSGQVSTSGVAQEDQAPDTGGAADDQAHGQHGTVRHLPAQPADKEEAQDDLHPAQAVHQAVGQLGKAEVALRHRSHHGLGEFLYLRGGGGWEGGGRVDVYKVRQSEKKVIQRELEVEIPIRAETSTFKPFKGSIQSTSKASLCFDIKMIM